MGTVFRGEDSDGRELAIKVLRPELADDPVLVARFVQERALLVRLSGPGIVRVVDLVLEGDLLAIVMERVNGGSLRHLIEKDQGRLQESIAADIIADVLSALGIAHAQGIVHRDIKPENILIDESVDPIKALLTDFGISGLTEGSSHTRMTSIVGTPDYMAPEVIDGAPATSAVDVYACGIVLYELIGGRAPFSGGHPMAVLKRHVEQQPQRPAAASAEAWALLQQMLAKDPLARPLAVEAAERLRGGIKRGVESDGWNYIHSGRPDLKSEPTNVRVIPNTSNDLFDESVTIQRTQPIDGGESTLPPTQIRPVRPAANVATYGSEMRPTETLGDEQTILRTQAITAAAVKGGNEHVEATSRSPRRKIAIWAIGSVLVLGLIAAFSLGIRWYDTNAYYVQAANNELIIYHGRVGGGVLYKPIEVERTGVTTADVPSYTLPQLVAGVQEDSLKLAQTYVYGLVFAQRMRVCAQTPGAVGCPSWHEESLPGL